MILDVSKGHIKVKLGEKIAIVLGEMFFPENGKMGFVIYKSMIKFWDFPEGEIISNHDIEAIINDIKIDFEKGGNVLDVEE